MVSTNTSRLLLVLGGLLYKHTYPLSLKEKQRSTTDHHDMLEQVLGDNLALLVYVFPQQQDMNHG